MSAAVIALVVGTALAIGALVFVLYPLFFEAERGRPVAAIARPASSPKQIMRSSRSSTLVRH